jgi:endonuclease YncB( thermonuclease family)
MIAIIPAALAIGLAANPAAEVDKALPFIADDYPKALAEARAQRLPLFIEAWAPW